MYVVFNFRTQISVHITVLRNDTHCGTHKHFDRCKFGDSHKLVVPQDELKCETDETICWRLSKENENSSELIAVSV